MWKEVAAKGTTATLAFSFFAIFCFFYHFGDLPSKDIIRAACILILLANMLRFWVSKKIGPEIVATKKNKELLKISVWINSIGWSAIFSTVALESSHEPFAFGIMITLMAGFLTSSIVTLSYDKSIYFPFQYIILIPLITTFLYSYYAKVNPNGVYLAMFFAFYFFYQLKQYRIYRQQLIERFSYQLDLEVSYEELKKGQKAFVEQTAKLIHASKISALGEMAGGLAHEVNNSLMVILGSTQQIERQLKNKGSMDETVKSKMEQTTNSIMKIKTVIEGLKSFSLQMEPSVKETTELKELVQRTLLYCQELIHAHGIKFEISDIPDVQIKCQPFQIIQILFNLTKNADDAVSGLRPADKWIKYEFEVKGHDVFIRVKNGGAKIPHENVERLFQPFFTTKEVNQGTGLSLSIAKGLAMEHKGDLYYAPEFGNTTFTLKLPII